MTVVGGDGDRGGKTAEPVEATAALDDGREEDALGVSQDGSSIRNAPRASAPLADDAHLSRIFGDPVPVEEARIWAAMPPSQRGKALQRIAALDRFCGGEEGLTAKQAAADAGVELGRFYQIARLWSTKRSLGNLGAYASATKKRQRLKPEVVNALQSVVARVVVDNKGASVTRLAQLLADASGLPPDQVPKKNTLRVFVEREQRRVRATRQAGHEVLFDCSAISLTRQDGGLHTAFLVIDDGTGLVLGHAVGEPAASVEGYGKAARNAAARILGDLLPAGIWAPALERTQLVPGADADLVKRLVTDLVADLGGVAPQLTRDGAFGRYIRSHLGQKLGPIQLMPSRTSTAAPTGTSAGEGLTQADADARLELAVMSHNAEVLAGMADDGESQPPERLVGLLAAMADRWRATSD